MGDPSNTGRWSIPPGGRGAFLGVLALLLAPAVVTGQYFGRNKVHYDHFDFRVLSTPHFDIHLYAEESDAVEDAARMAERWYERLGRLFEHEFDRRKPLIFYADHADFRQTNILSGSIDEATGGVTEGLKNRVVMPLTGAYAETDHVLGHELVHAFQYDLAQAHRGGGIPALARQPLWLVEGLAEYLSLGRNSPHTAMWLRDGLVRNDLPTIRQMTTDSRYFPYRYGHALWAYIGGTYGDDTVIDLFRGSLRSGWDAAVAQILGVTSDSLSVAWKRSIEGEYLPLMEGRATPGEVAELLVSAETGGGRQNVAPSLSPDGAHMAFLSEKDLFTIDLYLADARSGEIVRRLASSSSDPHFDALRYVESSGSWSPDGRRLVYAVFARGDNELVIVDAVRGGIEARIRVEGVAAIANPAWSPDGERLAFAGSRGGISDLFVLDLSSRALRQLTDDRHADLQPAWSPDGQQIAFVSDRGPYSDLDRLVPGSYQIALAEVSTGAVRPLALLGDVHHTNPQFSPDGRSLFFLADPDGFSDIYRAELDSGTLERVTRLTTGVSGITSISPALSVAARAGVIAFSVFHHGGFDIYRMDVAELGGPPDVADPAGRRLPPVSPAFACRVDCFLDDPETGLVPVGTFRIADARPYSPRLGLDYIGQPTIGVAADQFGTYVGGGASAFFSDLLGDRWLGVSVQAQGTFADIGGQVFYLNQKRRLPWGVGASRQPYIYRYYSVGPPSEGTQDVVMTTQRMYVDAASGFVAYPFSLTRRLEGSVGVTRYSWSSEAETYVVDPFGNIVDRVKTGIPSPDPVNLVNGSIAFVGDYSFSAFTSPVRGGRYRLEVGGATGTVDYGTLLADWRRYLSPSLDLTIAVRGFHFGRYGNTTELEEHGFRPFYLGYETLIRGYEYNSFETRECTATPESGCIELDRLFGHRLTAVNLEVRVPLTGTSRYGLIDFPYLPIELVGFADGGLAWDGDRPASLELSTTSLGRIPVFSAGASARSSLFGVLVLEIYFAYPFQRPVRGWHWGFFFAPGW